MGAEVYALHQRIDELKAALRPFAAMPDFHDRDDDEVVFKSAGNALTAGDIRRAQALLRTPR